MRDAARRRWGPARSWPCSGGLLRTPPRSGRPLAALPLGNARKHWIPTVGNVVLVHDRCGVLKVCRASGYDAKQQVPW